MTAKKAKHKWKKLYAKEGFHAVIYSNATHTHRSSNYLGCIHQYVWWGICDNFCRRDSMRGDYYSNT